MSKYPPGEGPPPLEHPEERGATRLLAFLRERLANNDYRGAADTEKLMSEFPELTGEDSLVERTRAARETLQPTEVRLLSGETSTSEKLYIKLLQEPAWFEGKGIVVTPEDRALAHLVATGSNARRARHEQIFSVEEDAAFSDGGELRPDIAEYEIQQIPRAMAELAFVTVDGREDLQPLGIQVAKLARTANLPVIMATGHHVTGALAIPLISRYMQERGLVSGELRRDWDYADEEHEFDADSGVFFVRKTEYQNWMSIFSALSRKLLRQKKIKPGYRILIVDDAFDSYQKAIEEGQHQSGKQFTIDVARDLQEATERLEAGGYDAVITDCYFPQQTGTHKKDQAETLYREIASSVLKEGGTAHESILAEAREQETTLRAGVTESVTELGRLHGSSE